MRIALTYILILLYFPTLAQLKSYKRGLASFENGHYNIALKEFEKVKEVEPEFKEDLYLKMGDAYRLSNRWLESIPHYEKLKKPAPEVLFYLGYAYKAKGEYQKAKSK